MKKQGCQCEKTAKIWENSKNRMPRSAYKIRKIWEGSWVWKTEKDWGVVWDLSCCRRGAPSAAEMCGNSRGCAGRTVAEASC